MILHNRLTKRAYQDIRTKARRKGSNIYPSLNRIRQYKMDKCTPKNVEIPQDGTVVQVPMEDVIKHQLIRILETRPKIKEKMIKLKETKRATFKFMFKYGTLL